MSNCSCACGIPNNAVILNQLHIVEYINAEDGEIYKVDMSAAGDGGEIAMGKSLELAEWAKAFTISPMIAEIVHDFVYGDDDTGDGDEQEPAEV